ncbi:hypothetical protein HanIR_Chr16g0797811 [Helianthus annuus]|nr:hypothetical protein HanIR_Chr16g0797811 [Helianthus annuus]
MWSDWTYDSRVLCQEYIGWSYVQRMLRVGEQGHFERDCLKMKGQDARSRAFELNAGKARDDLAVVTGMFQIKNQSMFILLIPKLT